MRNIYDQYGQPENRLTHALATTLYNDRSLVAPFLRWLGIDEIPNQRTLAIVEQQVPGSPQDDVITDNSNGLPDIAISSDDGWAVFFESKVQACTNLKQLEKHRNTGKKNGFESPWIVLVAVDSPSCELPARTIARQWQELYGWFNRRANASFWALQLVRYMEIFERKMIAQEYQINGTITVFDGLRFDEENEPYTYREGRRLIKLLGDLLHRRPDLHKLDGKIGVDKSGRRRPAITGRGSDGVWDFLPLNIAQSATQFTAYPHLTMAINRKRCIAAITIPNSVKGGFRKKLSTIGMNGFVDLVTDLEKRLRPILKRSAGAKPIIYATQRHFRSQSSPGEVDARIEVDIRTSVRGPESKIRYQPQWVEAIYNTLVHKRSNIQFGVELQFSYACPIVGSVGCADLFADTWKSLAPLLRLAL